ncbi:phosphatase PAP2 family protein [Mycolicibacterium goodii]|uniref:Membrane protein n=1 Tax=Mycolicibacterium goodii TaxID=134601 RepID=A0A0K0X0T6_MYCGD|nr:membrane protein [Mycolicibacterium goodii]
MDRTRGLLITTAVLAAVVYALMWFGYRAGWGWLIAFDDAGLDPAFRFGTGHPAWVTAWDVFCTVLGPYAFRMAAAVFIMFALLRRYYRVAVFALLTVELSGVVTQVAKLTADRPRPPTALVYAAWTSFPSGHALGVMTSVLAVLALIWPVLRAAWRGWAVAAGVLVILAIGVGRVVLNVHHPSDVIAGWALGYAFFVVCLLVAPPYLAVTATDETPGARGIAR